MQLVTSFLIFFINAVKKNRGENVEFFLHKNSVFEALKHKSAYNLSSEAEFVISRQRNFFPSNFKPVFR
jgi:hypothetical protein